MYCWQVFMKETMDERYSVHLGWSFEFEKKEKVHEEDLSFMQIIICYES